MTAAGVAMVSSTTVAVLSVAGPDGVRSKPSPAFFQVTGAVLPRTRAAVTSKVSFAVRCSALPAAGQSYTARYILSALRVTAPQVGSATRPVVSDPYSMALWSSVLIQPPIPRRLAAIAGGTAPVLSGPMLSSRLPSRAATSSRLRVSCGAGFQVSYRVQPHRLPVV